MCILCSLVWECLQNVRRVMLSVLFNSHGSYYQRREALTQVMFFRAIPVAKAMSALTGRGHCG